MIKLGKVSEETKETRAFPILEPNGVLGVPV